MILLQNAFLLCFISVTMSQSNDDYGGCQPFYTHNYGYKIYFHLPKSAVIRNNSIHFVFSVQASSDAHILLSSTPNPKDTDPLYEIVIGAGGNTFSDLRRLHQKPYRYTNRTIGILNKNVIKKFWIKADDGNFSIGIGDSLIPIIRHKDDNPIPLQYMSFSSWWGNSAMWLFDCLGATSVPVNKTGSDRLKKDLLTKYDPYVVPTTDDNSVVVSSFLLINHIDLDTSSSSMKVSGNLRVNWVDPKLQWVPEKYEGLRFLRFEERTIWQPLFILYNGANLYQKWFEDGIIKVDFEGGVVWITSVHFNTRCDIKMDKWPNDEHSCHIQIGLDAAQQNVYLTELRGLSMDHGGNVGSWELLSVNGSVPYADINSSSTGNAPVLVIDISMRRHSSTHYYIFYVPLKVTMAMSVISFCLPYNCPQRIIIQVIALIIYTLNLLSIDSALPEAIGKTPSIVYLNCGVFLVAVVSTILTIWLVQLSQRGESLTIPKLYDKLVDFFTLYFNFFRNFRKKGRKLMNLEDEDNEGEFQGEANTQDKKTDSHTNQGFLKLLDSLLLYIVIIVYIILLIIF